MAMLPQMLLGICQKTGFFDLNKDFKIIFLRHQCDSCFQILFLFKNS